MIDKIKRLKGQTFEEAVNSLSIKINEIIDVIDSLKDDIDALGAVGGEKWCPRCGGTKKVIEDFDSIQMKYKECPICKPKDKPSEVSLGSIIDEWCSEQGRNGKEIVIRDDRARLLLDIRKWIESRLPKEKQLYIPYTLIECNNRGYNKCLEDVKKSLGVE